MAFISALHSCPSSRPSLDLADVRRLLAGILAEGDVAIHPLGVTNQRSTELDRISDVAEAEVDGAALSSVSSDSNDRIDYVPRW